MTEIKVYKFKEVNLEGATIVNGFPTLGLSGTIAANYLLSALKLDQIGALDSDDFPPVSMIYDSKPKLPVRIYASEKDKIAIFISEFRALPELARPIANAILSWAIDNKCRRIITPEALAVMDEKKMMLEIYAVGSTDRAREEINNLKIDKFTRGIITGVSGIMLNEGRRKNLDVVTLVAEASPNVSDARAAAKLLETIVKFIPQANVDLKPLYVEAERIETFIKGLVAQVKTATKQISPEPEEMYR